VCVLTLRSTASCACVRACVPAAVRYCCCYCCCCDVFACTLVHSVGLALDHGDAGLGHARGRSPQRRIQFQSLWAVHPISSSCTQAKDLPAPHPQACGCCLDYSIGQCPRHAMEPCNLQPIWIRATGPVGSCLAKWTVDYALFR
jgi:hypothetical protein